jgi:3-hydroxybutyryl-CoA dehydrogenase
MSALPTLLKRPLVEIAPTVFSPKETLEVVSRFFQSIQKEIEIVQDRVGMVLPRILCQLINESGFALTEEIAEPMDIDTAMKLGANYPYGPIEWAERIGLRQVVSVIDALQRDLKEERYRLSPLLAQMAKTGEYWRKSQAEDK